MTLTVYVWAQCIHSSIGIAVSNYHSLDKRDSHFDSTRYRQHPATTYRLVAFGEDKSNH